MKRQRIQPQSLWTNPWAIGAGIVVGAGVLAAVFPDSFMSGPGALEAKPAHAAHHQNEGNGYGIIRFEMPKPEAATAATTVPTTAPTTAPALDAAVVVAATEPTTPTTPTTQLTQTSEAIPTISAAASLDAPTTAPTMQVIVEPPVIAPTVATQPTTAASPSEVAAVPPIVATQPATTTQAAADDMAKSDSDSQDHLTDRWFGEARSRLVDRGITVNATLATYLGDNLHGGALTNHAGTGYEFDLNFALDSRKLLGYEGGTLFANFRSQDGLEHSLDGSFGNTSHLYAPQLTTVSEIWYQQTLFNDKLRLKIGKIDANADFDFVQNGGEFLNDFASHSATVLAMPTDPDPAPGALAFFQPNDHFYAGAGIFDGSLQQGVATGGQFLQSGFRSAFMIGEAGAKWSLPAGRDGRLGIGVWHHTGAFDHVDDASNDTGATGPYLSFDQILCGANPDKDDDNRGIAMFILAGYADPRISQVQRQVSGGVKWTGLVPGRDDDILAFGAGYLEFSQAADAGFDRSNEISFETFYRYQFSPWLSVQPDIQYVHNPGGNSSHSDAVAATIQMLLNF